MILRRKLGSLLLLFAAQSLHDVAASDSPLQAVADRLSNPDYAVRFDAALILANTDYPRVEELLVEAQQAEAFTGAEAKAAVEFVRWWRAGAEPSHTPLPPQKGANVLFISLDTLRADHLGCYGYSRETSPTLDALAQRGALFERAMSVASWTLPSHMTIFTSLYPSFHKLDLGGWPGEDSIRLDDSERTLAEVFRSTGYRTAGLVAHPYLAREWGFDRGFHLYRRYTTRAEEQTQRAILWLTWHLFHVERGLGPSRFFFFVHYLDPHETYDPPSPYRERFAGGYEGTLDPTDQVTGKFAYKDFPSPKDLQFVIDLYDGEIAYLDSNLADLFGALEDSGLGDRTAIVVTSDHGEEFKDHGSMGHKRTLYREQLNVPLIITHPERIKPGQRVEGRVSHVDLFPTMLDLAGVKPVESTQGVSLLSQIAKPGAKKTVKPPPSRDLFAELAPIGHDWKGPSVPRRVLRTDAYKLIYAFEQDGTLSRELYHVPTDPAEKKNLYESMMDDELVRDLEKRLSRFIRSGIDYNEGFRERNSIQLDEEILEKLRGLGYIN